MASKTSRASEASQDAIAALTADHEKVKKLFKQFQKLKDQDDQEKAALVEQICTELKIHSALEEEIFYPAVREQIDDADLMDESLVEHAGAKSLIEQLEGMSPDEELYDAKVTVLCEQINHHVEEEEGEMFPKAKKAKMDTAAIGAQMAQRRAQLRAELGEEQDEVDVEAPGGIASTRGDRPRRSL